MNIAARWPIASQQPSALNGPNGSTQGAREVRLEAGTALCEVEGLSILQPGTGAESASLAAGRAEHSASPASSLASRCRMESGGAPKVSARTGDGAARFSANLHDENEKRGFPQSCSTRDDGSRQGLAGSGPGWEPRVWNIEEAGGVMVSGLPVTAPPRVGTSWPGDAPRGRNREAVHEDGVDWEGVRAASVEEIADAIKERGMHMMLAARYGSREDAGRKRVCH